MINKELIQNKLSEMQSYYTELQPILGTETTEILRDTLKLRALERLFQLIIDTALDINSHIIAESDTIQSPEDFQSTFILLGEHNVLPQDFSLKIAPSVGLRNKVVHKYGKIDLRQMITAIKNEIPQYLEYMKHITHSLER